MLGSGIAYLYDKYQNSETQYCAFWVNDHYEKLPCENDRGLQNGIQINAQNVWLNYSDNRKINFEINQPFQSINGTPIIWYSFGQNGYEFFNFSGSHPITNKVLKPVTQEFVDSCFAQENNASMNDPANSKYTSTFDAGDSYNDSPEILPEETRELGPFCELNNTGIICLKNLGTKEIRVILNPQNDDPKNSLNIKLQGMERVCYENWTATNYTYKVYIYATNQLIEQGQFVLVKCQTKTLNFEVPEEKKKEVVEPPKEDTRPKRCETKELGDYCFTNKGAKPLHIIISDYHSNSPLSQRYLKLDLNAGQTGCYYDVPIGAYNVEYYVETRAYSKYSKVKIKMCEEGHSDLQY